MRHFVFFVFIVCLLLQIEGTRKHFLLPKRSYVVFQVDGFSLLNPITYSRKTLARLLTGGGYGIISAGRNPAIPSDFSLSDEAIAERTKHLTVDLNDNFVYASIKGVYEGNHEESFFFMLRNAQPRRERRFNMNLGREYNQDSIIYVKKSKPAVQQLIYTTGKLSGKYVQGQGYTELFSNTTDNYSELYICSNSTFRFTLNFDFDNMITGASQVRTQQAIDHHTNNRLINQQTAKF